MAGPNLGILIPAFNEEKTVSIVINEAKKFGDVILSDDNSTDNTKEISLQAGALVIDNVFEKGYDGNLKTLLKYASETGHYRSYVTIDADGELPPAQIENVIECCKFSSLCIGERNQYNRMVEYILSAYFFLKYGVKDPLSGMKVYSIELLREFYCDDCDLNIGTAVIKFCKKRQHPIRRFPISVEKRIGSSRFGGSLFSAMKIMRVILRDLA